MSEKQLHEPRLGMESGPFGFAVRSCEMEARSVPQHRMKMNLQAGMLIWVSGPKPVTPNIRSWSTCSGGGSGGKSLCLTPGDLDRSTGCIPTDARVVRPAKETTTAPNRFEKSDHLIVATKPGNAGGAKGVTS